MRIYLPIAKVDAANRLVYGYASTEARDDQGEIVKREAMNAALGDYMKFANIREMHQLSAVGKAKEASVDDKGLYIGAKIVDDDAWEKVVERVYNGFSIGGKVTARLQRTVIQISWCLWMAQTTTRIIPAPFGQRRWSTGRRCRPP